MKVISYNQLVIKENGKQIQKGMNFAIQKTYSVVLMSTQKNAPYNDHILEDGVIEYEGHDIPTNLNPEKKLVDQSLLTPSGKPTENGKFFQAALDYKHGLKKPSQIQVYRKLRKGIWVDMGFYDLIDAYEKADHKRKVFKFLLRPKIEVEENDQEYLDLLHNRQIPGDVQKEVYERDKGRCVECGSTDNLHFDHILPFSKGGSSKTANNIQLLCARHNLKKGAKFI